MVTRAQAGLVAGPLLAAVMLLMSPPDGMTTLAWRTAAVGALMAAWWVTEAIPIAATALLPIVLFPLLGVSSVAAATAPYANPAIYLFLGGFLIAMALEGCGLHRRLALADLLGGDFSLAEIHRLYECHDKILEHKTALFDHLTERWRILFDAKFEVLLYDLTSTYFESDPPEDRADMRRFGYSRDKRSDCVQVVIALIVTPEGFPIAYEVLPGNTTDKTTLSGFLRKIEAQYGKADRIWIMDRGIPTEDSLA